VGFSVVRGSIRGSVRLSFRHAKWSDLVRRGRGRGHRRGRVGRGRGRCHGRRYRHLFAHENT